MNKFINGLNGITADMVKTVASISAESAKQAAEARSTEKAQLSSKFESFRPVAADKIEKQSRPIERLYAGMAPATKTEQHEETIAERVAAIKQPKVVTKHEPVPHDSYLLEPKIKLQPKIKRTMEAESVELSDEDKAFLAQLNGETNEAKLDAVGKEDADVNNDGKVNSSDSFLKKRRAAISASIKGKKVSEEKEESAAHEKKEKKGNNPFDWKNYKNDFVKRKPGELTGHESKKTEKGVQYTKKMEEEVEQVEEKKLQDTPGQGHMCAVHVKHSKLGEGKTLHGQHAEPDADGYIAWYDVMFAEEILRVNTKELEVLEAMMHGNHKKK